MRGISETPKFRCRKCRVRKVFADGDYCNCCRYAGLIEYMLEQLPDDRDWSFSYCEECGSRFDDCGICRNTRCGASPDVGMDWQ